jgi:hypothetical protein
MKHNSQSNIIIKDVIDKKKLINKKKNCVVEG